MELSDVLHVLVDGANFAGDSVANNDLKAEAHAAIDKAYPPKETPAEVTPQSLDANAEVPVDPPGDTQPAES